MTPAFAADKPNRKMLVMSGAIIAAMTINVGLLLLIGGLISERQRELAQTPNLQPVDFVRFRPTRKELPTPAVEAKEMVTDKPAAAKPKPAAENTTTVGKKPAARTGKPAKSPIKQPGVAAPRLDIPAHGDGVAFPGVPGTDERLTAPPGQWNVAKQPEPRESAGGDEHGKGTGYAKSRLVVLSRVLPDYPPRARSLGIQGWVQLEIIVNPSGKVSAAKVVDAKPKEVFEEAALAAIKQWRFQPAYKNGQAIEQRALQRVDFRLETR